MGLHPSLCSHLSLTVQVALSQEVAKTRGEERYQSKHPSLRATLHGCFSEALKELQGCDSKMQQLQLQSCQSHGGVVTIRDTGGAVNAGEMLEQP